MGDHRFDYPTVAGTTANIVFTRGAQLVGDSPGLRINQEVDYTLGGKPRARNFGTPKRVWPLTVIVAMSGSETDLEDLVTWIGTTVNGAVNTFQWTDSEGTVRTVRITNSDFSFSKFGHDGYACQLMLEVE